MSRSCSSLSAIMLFFDQTFSSVRSATHSFSAGLTAQILDLVGCNGTSGITPLIGGCRPPLNSANGCNGHGIDICNQAPATSHW